MERVLVAGDRVGDYTIVANLADGGSYIAVDRDHSRRVVIEVGRPAELRDVPRLTGHPGIAAICDHGTLAEANGKAWRAVELVEGIALYDVLSRRRLAAFEVAALMRDVADVLSFAHQRGLAHGALAIRSVWLATDASSPAGVSVRGWGWRPAHVDINNVFVAPEGAIDGRADIYALGVIAYRAYTGVFPPDLLLDPPGIGELGVLILRMLASDPAMRPSAGEIRVACGRLVEELSGSDDRVGVVAGPRFSRPKWTPPPPAGATPVTGVPVIGSTDRGRLS